MAEADDPRIYFAAERTLLAWVRTGLTVIGLGFVVARFGLFLRIVRQGADATATSGSTWIGVGLVLLGSAAIAAAAWQHLRFWRTLTPEFRARATMMRWSVSFAALIALIGAALGAYLLLNSHDASSAARPAARLTKVAMADDGFA